MVKLFSKNSNLCDHNLPTLQMDRQTDGRTDRRHAIAKPRFALKCIARLKLLILPTPHLFDASAWGEPLIISGWNLLRKTRGMGLPLPYGENFIILTSTVFTERCTLLPPYDLPFPQNGGSICPKDTRMAISPQRLIRSTYIARVARSSLRWHSFLILWYHCSADKQTDGRAIAYSHGPLDYS